MYLHSLDCKIKTDL